MTHRSGKKLSRKALNKPSDPEIIQDDQIEKHSKKGTIKGTE